MQYIDRIPDDLDIQSIAPHDRHPWARDETCFNASSTRFVIAFNIVEATMLNDMGMIVWGSGGDQQSVVVGCLQKVAVYCWERPFAYWLDDKCFTVKVDAGRHSHPVIAVHFDKGFQILNGLDNLDSRASHAEKAILQEDWLTTESQLIKAICS
ncbi:hypothetical protein [Coralliovum pocilloporae]|uniref:hypothetical protein n=1 Tax=Coralliovum pocilloporae TaxID=3066369 RepID=UPI00330722AD